MKTTEIGTFKEVKYRDIDTFAEYVTERVLLDVDLFVTVVGKYDEIKAVMRFIFDCFSVSFEVLHLESPYISGYEDEYYLSLWYDEDGLQIGCEFAKEKGEYMNPCGDETYIFNNSLFKILTLYGDESFRIVSIDKESKILNNQGECNTCECRHSSIPDESTISNSNRDDELFGFTISSNTGDSYKSLSLYSSDEITKDSINDMLRKIGFTDISD